MVERRRNGGEEAFLKKPRPGGVCNPPRVEGRERWEQREYLVIMVSPRDIRRGQSPIATFPG